MTKEHELLEIFADLASTHRDMIEVAQTALEGIRAHPEKARSIATETLIYFNSESVEQEQLLAKAKCLYNAIWL